MTAPVLPAATGSALAVGVLLVAAGLRNTSAPSGWHARWPWSLQTGGRALAAHPAHPVRLVAAAGSGGLAWLVTGWVVALPLAAAAFLGLPALVRPDTAASRELARLQACADWARGLADRLVAGIALEQAIAASQSGAPPAIAVEVGALAARLRNGWPTQGALAAFADDLDTATGDLLVAGLTLSARRRGAGLAQVLDELADSIADTVTMRRRIDADRARPRTTARLVTLIAVGAFALLQFDRDYLAPYSTPVGQAVLAAISGVFVGALAWMRALAASPAEPRFLETTATGSQHRPAGRVKS